MVSACLSDGHCSDWHHRFHMDATLPVLSRLFFGENETASGWRLDVVNKSVDSALHRLDYKELEIKDIIAYMKKATLRARPFKIAFADF